MINRITVKDSGLITVINVKTSGNLRFSKIYISFIGNKVSSKVLIDSMNDNIKEYRYQLGKSLQLKYVPQIKFYYDNRLEEMEHINAIINKAKNDK